jgi:hypothetical protein
LSSAEKKTDDIKKNVRARVYNHIGIYYTQINNVHAYTHTYMYIYIYIYIYIKTRARISCNRLYKRESLLIHSGNSVSVIMFKNMLWMFHHVQQLGNLTTHTVTVGVNLTEIWVVG